MNALLSLIQKALVGIFVLGFGALIVIGLLRYKGGGSEEGDVWQQVKLQNTVEAYLDYLRQCQSCPREEDAERALDDVQRPRGLLARLTRRHLPARASIGLPVFSPDGRTVLAAGGSGLDFWDARTGEHRPRDEDAFAIRGGQIIETLAYSPDGKRVAAGMSGTEGGNMLVWDEKTGKLVADHSVEGYDVKLVAFSPQGAQVGWLAHGPVGVWEPDTGKSLRATHEGSTALSFLRGESGKTYLLSAAGRELWFWDPATMEPALQVEIKSDRALLGLTQEGRLIAYFDGPILELWDTRTRALVATLAGHDGEVVSFCREPRSGWVAVGTRPGTLYLWDVATSKRLGWVPAHEGPVEQLACSGHGRVVTIGWDSAKVWNLDKLLKWHTQHQGRVSEQLAK